MGREGEGGQEQDGWTMLCSGGEWEEKARKAKNKMAGQCEQHKTTVQQHEMGRQRSSQIEKCYRGFF